MVFATRCCWLKASFVFVLFCSHCVGDDSVKALAVLQRIVDVRAAPSAFSVDLEYEIIREGTRFYRMHVSGDMLRVDEFKDSSFDQSSRISSTLVRGDEAYFYTDSPQADLQRTVRSKVDKAGSNAFAPRAIGLTFIADLVDDLPKLLYVNSDSISLLVAEEINGVAVEHIEVQRGNFVIGYRVNVETGRVYQMIAFQDMVEFARVKSTFAEDSEINWMPSEVVVSFFNTNRIDFIKNIKCISEAPATNLFEIASLGIPEDIQVVDRELSRSVGQWNGSEIVVEAEYEDSQIPEENHSFGYLIIGAVGIVVFFVLFKRFGRKKA